MQHCGIKIQSESDCIRVLHLAAVGAMAGTRENSIPVRVTTNLSTNAAERLNSIASAQRVKVSWLVARAIDEFLDRYGDDESPQLPLRSPRNR
jgi:hypothetical protein